MTFNVNEIGKTAGKVWVFLNLNGEKDWKCLQRSLNLTDALYFFALGWLAREGKILIKEGKNGNKNISLT